VGTPVTAIFSAGLFLESGATSPGGVSDKPVVSWAARDTGERQWKIEPELRDLPCLTPTGNDASRKSVNY
jgi:hypothetical protein